eukprot:14885102-Alexandrium_andersonii.AAC.1
MEPLSDPRADGLCCSQQRHGRAGEAGSPAAREACGPPAPGAQPAHDAVRLARVVVGPGPSG